MGDLCLACEQAHLVCYSCEYLGGGSRKENGVRKSEPAGKPLNFEFCPCEVTSQLSRYQISNQYKRSKM